MRGVTLIELLVVLTILGLILGVCGLAFASLQMPRESQALSELRRAHVSAIQSGESRMAHGVRFLPDGRAIGSGVDPLTGNSDAR